MFWQSVFIWEANVAVTVAAAAVRVLYSLDFMENLVIFCFI